MPTQVQVSKYKFDKHLLTIVEEEVYQPDHTLSDVEPTVTVGPFFTKFPDTVPTIRLLAPLGNSNHALLSFKIGLNVLHEPTHPRAKWCYNERKNGAVVEAAALFEWSDASLARNEKTSELE